MKLIIVNRSKPEVFSKLMDKFVDDPNVHVVWDRRKRPNRVRKESVAQDRRKADRRRLRKDWQGRDYVVIHVVEDRPKR